MSSHHQQLRTTLLVDRWRDRVWAACPAYVLRENACAAELFVPDASTWLVPDRPRAEFADARRTGRWRLTHAVRTNDVLWHMASTTPWGSALINKAGSRNSTQVYLSLQSPAAAGERAFVYTDWTIDVIADPATGQHVTKDLDEWDQAVAAGVFTPAEQREISAALELLLGRLTEDPGAFAMTPPPEGLPPLHLSSTSDTGLAGHWEDALAQLKVRS